jgi:hypothetical protein
MKASLRRKSQTSAVNTDLFVGCRLALSTFTLTLIVCFLAPWSLAQEATTPSANKPRVEKDLLGEKEILASAYHGVQTARALENFQLSGVLDQSLSRLCGGMCVWSSVTAMDT